jgi:hypothetical protein
MLTTSSIISSAVDSEDSPVPADMIPAAIVLIVKEFFDFIEISPWR